ncbi:MAG: hypothetical protein KF708_23080 [Pirellulales bacterium]|nr:hypothetical protein [Pirellulales bacterium]
MKKLALAALTAALLWVAPSGARAQDEPDMKPLFVVSFAGWQELVDDIELVGKETDDPELAQGIEGLLTLVTQGQGLQGLDKERPWGLVVQTDELQFQILGFLPVTDLDKFLEALAAVGEPEDLGDGVFKLDIQPMPIFFKQSGDWTYISIGNEFPEDLPEDPVSLLDGLNKEYDIAVRAYIANIPEIFRQLAVEQLKIGMEEGFGNLPIPGLENLPIPELPENELAKKMAQGQIESLIEGIEDTDQVTFGVTIDRDAKKSKFDIVATAVEDSKLAESLGRLKGQTTRFGAFMVPDATLSGTLSATLSDKEIENMLASAKTLREEANSQLDKVDALSDESIRDRVKEFVGKVFDIVDDSIESGRADAGVALLGDGPFTLVVGTHVAEGKQAQALLDEFVETVENEVGFYGFQRDVAKVDDVRFHQVVAPLPGGPEADKIAELFGDTLSLTFGVGETSFYLGIGEEGLDKLKEFVEKSKETSDKEVAPLQLTLKLNPLLKLASEQENADPNLATAAAVLKDGQDRVNVTVNPLKNGVSIHVEGEPGLMKLLGTVGMSLGAGLGLPTP